MKTLRFSLDDIKAAFAGGATVEALALEAAARADAYGDPAVWIMRVSSQDLRARARALDALDPAARAKMPLFGVPCAIKDNMDWAGTPTTAGCPAYAYSPTETALCVRKLEDAGAVIIGKTNMDQFATGLAGNRTPYGAARSVFGKSYVSGGSSSGSAVAVAAGLVGFALGTDTAGSGRVPAMFNNIVGLKPTRGIVSATGIVPANRSIDCVAILALEVGDAMTVLDAVAEADQADPFSRVRVTIPPANGGAFRFAVPSARDLDFYGDTGNAGLFNQAVATLVAMGGEKVEVDLQPFKDGGAILYEGGWIAERTAELGPFVEANRDKCHPTVAQLIMAGKDKTAMQVFLASHRLEGLKREANRVLSNVDFLFTPTSPTTYTIDEMEKDPIALAWRFSTYTGFVNMLDLAAIAVPAGLNPKGLPFGVQFIGPIFTETRMAPMAARFMNVVGVTTGGPAWRSVSA